MTPDQTPDFDHITTVIFDMDGTLIKHTWQMSRLCEVLFDRFAEPLSPLTQTEFFECYWAKSVDMWYMMVDGAIDGETAAKYGYVNALRHLGQDVALAEAMLDMWETLVLEEAVPFDDAVDVLDSVRERYTTGILTNGFTRLQRKKINKYKLADHVDFTLVSEEAGYHKPDPEIFKEVLKLAGNATPQQTLYVGDNPVADIEGADGAGITPIFMNAKSGATPPVAALEIKSLSELLGLLKL